MPRVQSQKGEREERNRGRREGVSSETVMGIFVIFLFALAALCILSLFGLAGPAGEFFLSFLVSGFGLGRYLIPVILISLGYIFLNEEKYQPNVSNYLGLFLFVLSLSALL